jgi:2-(1,2-epoxy-1,2-dihydrophenyl)acetyl-CoA isomerase
VVLTGAGRGFCAGQDLREHADLLAAGDPAPLETVQRHFNPLCLALATMPKPVIAAVNGIAAGAGASMTFTADFRIAADGAKFLLAFANVGLGLDTGASWTLPRLIGQARATALALLAEPVSASAALEMGLVNAVVPGRPAAGRRARAGGAARGRSRPPRTPRSRSSSPSPPRTRSPPPGEGGRAAEPLGASPTTAARTAAFVRKEQPVFEGR